MTPPIYKFMESQWADAFVSGESILISTLYEFRKVEKHELDRGDLAEGLFNVAHAANTDTTTIGDASNPDLKHALFAATGATFENVTFQGGRSAIGVSVPDLFILCCSTALDPTIASGLDAKYDHAVLIPRPADLAQRVGLSLHLQTGYTLQRGFGDTVSYEPRSQTAPEVTAIDPSPLIKDRRFAYQREFRMCWPTTQRSIAPQRVQIDPRDLGLEIVWRR